MGLPRAETASASSAVGTAVVRLHTPIGAICASVGAVAAPPPLLVAHRLLSQLFGPAFGCEVPKQEYGADEDGHPHNQKQRQNRGSEAAKRVVWTHLFYTSFARPY